MKLNINPLNFRAQYWIRIGDLNSKVTASRFDEAITTLQQKRDLAVKSQQYMEKRSTRIKIESVPSCDTVEFYNPRVFLPFPDFIELKESTSHLLYKSCYGDDKFEFKLDEYGNLNEAEADEWLNSKLGKNANLNETRADLHTWYF